MYSQYDMGRYTYSVNQIGFSYRKYSLHPARCSDIDVRVKSYDHMLHQLLDNIFRERCLSDSDRFKDFLRGPQLRSKIKPILEQEPFLGKHFTKEELGKLSLLWIAVLCCYEKSTELLVRSGADVNELFGGHDPQVIDEEWTILQVLIRMRSSSKNEQLIRLIIDHGADLQARDYNGKTILHYAVENDQIQMTKMLLEKGANINVADDRGLTPLFVTVKYSNKAKYLLPLLMKHGADVLAKSRCGGNALHILTNVNTTRKHVDLARILIEKGASLDDRNFVQDQPIHKAAMYPYHDLVKLYLDHGANANALGNRGESPLHRAALYDNNTVVETLLNHGANIRLRTFKGQTALHYACLRAADTEQTRRFFPTNEDSKPKIIIRLLLCAGADVLAEDNDGKTPLAFISSRQDGELPEQESWPVIEVLALRKALQPSIELKDERIIERHPKLRDYCQKCIDEIDRMKSTRFIETCTLFELLAKSQCKIAMLMQNPEFETQFRLYDLNDGFPIYARHVVRAFERSEDHYNSLREQENVINEATYDTLPYLVVKKVVLCIFNCCENVK